MSHALLLVDLQGDFLTTPQLQPPADALIARAAGLLQACRRRQLPVLHIWTTVRREGDDRLPHWRESNRWMCVAGTPGHEPPDALRPVEGEAIIHKTGFNAFADGELDKVLRQTRCDSVIVAGLHMHACVRAVAVECLERGWRVCVAEEAVASNDPIHAAATRRWLAERCVAFESTGALLARLDGRAPPRLIHRSPRRSDEVLFEIPVAGRVEIESATAAAQAGWVKWRQTNSLQRLEILARVAERLEAAAPQFARQMALEIGKPISHGLEEVRRAAANVRDVIHRAAKRPSITREAAGLVRHQPVGVIGIITAWNNPVAIPIGKIAPALAYGNSVVWKPAPAGTRIAQALLVLLHECGVPGDSTCLVSGDHTTAQRIAADPNITAVTLTGSLLAGYAIQEICARRVVPLQAELSGNNAAIVWDDANLADAAAQVAWGAFAFAGQRCTANRRVIVSVARFDALVNELERAAGRLPWGEPLEPATEIGPLISTARRDEDLRLIAAAESNGAAHRVVRLHEQRATEPWAAAGAYAPPVVACCDQPGHALVQEETISPLLVVQRAGDFAQALALCNGVRHGLIASLFSSRDELQRRFLDEAEAGVLKLNAATAGVDVALPFGGWKASGLGPPEHGEGDSLFYTRMQAVYGADRLTEPPPHFL
jgi:alpha-ketoglutaric semialdehyde dehydrogenase